MNRLLRYLLLIAFSLAFVLPFHPAVTTVRANDANMEDSRIRITVGETNRNFTRYVVKTNNPEFNPEEIFSDPSKVSFQMADSSVAQLVQTENPVFDHRDDYSYTGQNYTNEWDIQYYTVKAVAPGTTHVDVYYDGKKVFELPDIIVSAPVKMWRLYNSNSGEHFYTADTHERDVLYDKGWNIEGVGWVAPAEGAPVYRMYNPNAGDHHYTTDAHERDMLKKAGWRYEKVGWYSGGQFTLKREYNPNAYSCNHNYTADMGEHRYLVDVGWRDEGDAWKALDRGSSEGERIHSQN